MTDIPTAEPLSIIAGTTLTWKRSLSDYPASTYTLSYYLVNASGQIEIVASASGDDHLVEVAPAVTAAYTAGKYSFQGILDDSTNKYPLFSDRRHIEIRPDFSAQDSGYDDRTVAQKMLDALEAVLPDVVAGKVASISVAGRSSTYRTLDEWTTAHDKCKALVKREEQQERVKRGKGSGRIIKARFSKV